MSSSSFVSSTRILKDSEVRSHAPGVSEMAQAFAGKAKMLAELATGAAVLDGEGLATPLNPQGLIGIDFSGPPWGSALLHPVAWMDGVLSTTTSLVQPTRRHVVAAGRPITIGRWRVINRPHAPLPSPSIAPYDRALVIIRNARTTGAGTITATVTCRNHWLNQDGATSADVDTFTCSSAVDASDAAGFIRLRSGANEISIELAHDNAGHELEVISCLLYVGAKRSY